MSIQIRSKDIYFENLDGLRFLCFLSVFFFHSFFTESEYLKSTDIYQLIKYDLFGNGNLGVNFFFVLSGFLITYLLIKEKQLTGQIDLKRFWIRRILRIWPLFYLCVIFGFFIFPLLKSYFGQTPNETANIWYYITFLNNFDSIKNGLPDSSVLGVLWSVAIEEQFYFLWPLILYFLPLKKYWIVFGTIIIVSIIFRGFYDIPIIHEYHTLSCIGDMTIGAMGAWLILVRPSFKGKIQHLKSRTIWIIYTLLISVFLFRDLLQSNYFLRIFERSFIAIIILMVILEQNFSNNSLFKLSRFKTISKLGTISYALYCLHFVGILVTTTLLHKVGLDKKLIEILLLQTAMALGLTIIISKISYRFFEKPFLKLKAKFAIIDTKPK